MSRAPLFLAREVYRRRRWRDAARLLPLMGVFLLILPMLWGKAVTGAAAVLIGLAAVLAPRLAAEPEAGRNLPRPGDQSDA